MKMSFRQTEQKTILHFLLIGIITFMILPLGWELFYPNPTFLVIKISLLIFLSSLYLFNKTSQKTELTIHLLLIGIYAIFTSAMNIMNNTDIMSIWYFIIPLFAFILLSPRQALIYSVLIIITVPMSFVLYPESASALEKFRVITFGLFVIGTLYILAQSRNKAWEETEYHIQNLENEINEALKEKHEQKKLLIQTSKLAALGELLSSISHQWKQPLANISAINMNLRLQEELSGDADGNRIQLIDQLEEQTAFMSKTMDDFRSFFNAKDEQRSFGLSAASTGLIKLFGNSFKAQGINFNHVDAESIEVYGYSKMYKQALLNIITNAKDVINEKQPANKDIDISYAKDDTCGIVYITDHAGGIPQNIINRIFEKDFTTKGEKGSGIGLAMTKEIIEDFCHGKVSVENRDDGARFSIHIPLLKN